ncbi:hypothetical protein [Actinomyces ruminis]|uniref:hypothetical protein n=1 Tax=Actinomyces ruminis TaxID=1937003 RepID=UPI00211E6579|nr:hypothetical protein [Actinomyces ruminis]
MGPERGIYVKGLEGLTLGLRTLCHRHSDDVAITALGNHVRALVPGNHVLCQAGDAFVAERGAQISSTHWRVAPSGWT